MKQYTIGLRQEDYDEVMFLHVMAVNAFQAEKIAEKKARKDLKEPGEPAPTIYVEFTIEGHINVLANYTSYGADDNYLKTV